jgi:hypothetical protein
MKRFIAILAGSLTAAVMTPALAAHAAISTTIVCGAQYLQVQVPGNSYYYVKNAPPAQNETCIQAGPGRPGFTILSVDQHRLWGYPHVASGWEWGEYSCFGGSGGACFAYPVQERLDGMPLTSMSVSMLGEGNASYDIWFNKTGIKPMGQDDGAEIMLWLRHPGASLRHIVRTVRIEGINFRVMAWTAHGHGTTWNYVAYVCVKQRSILRNFWLNGLFRDAVRHHELSPYWWLTNISAGFELTGGGAGSRLSMSLQGVN